MHHLTRRQGPTIALALFAALVFGAAVASAETVTLGGSFHVIHGTGRPGTSEDTHRFLMHTDAGATCELLFDDDGEERLFLDRRHVLVKAETVEGRPDEFHVLSVAADGGGTTSGSLSPTPRSGSLPWVSILVRFADETSLTPQPVSYFQDLMSSTAPGLAYYWQDVSYGNITLSGSAVVGWFNLPQPKSYYVTNGQIDFLRAANDATAVANGSVNFSNFYGINIMFNDDFSRYSWGGTEWLALNGASRLYGVTWMPTWGYESRHVMAHEMGHGFGLMHSSGPYTATYDSNWDVMSGGPSNGGPAVGTIAFHKDALGWIPSSRKFVATQGTNTITIERLARPDSTTDYLMAQIPIAGSTTRFYTVEARMYVDYEWIPSEGVIMHLVDLSRADRIAQVVDPDNDGNPNYGSEILKPGDSFNDATNGISVSVVSQGTTSFTVTIAVGGSGGGGVAPAIASPTPGSTLASSSVTFTWSAGTSATAYWLWVGRTVGAADLSNSGNLGTSLSKTVAGLPTDGSTVYVRLWYLQGGVWLYVDATFTAANSGGGVGVAPAITSPTPGSTLGSSSATFAWSADTSATAYWLYIGRAVGARDLFDSGNLGTNLSKTVVGLPTDGSTVYVRLWYQQGGAWPYVDVMFTSASGEPAITSPRAGSTLPSSSVTFTWSAGAAEYWLYVGRTAGARDILDSGDLGTNLSTTVTGLPMNGSAVYARLWYMAGGVWLFTDSTFSAASGAPSITSPAPGSTLSSSAATFVWNAGAGVTGYWLYVGSTLGGVDLLNQNEGMSLSTSVSGLPTDGRTIYIRLWYQTANGWQHADTTCQAW